MTENLFSMINDLAEKQSKQDETLQMILQLLKKLRVPILRPIRISVTNTY